ncbi:MAG: outer membrane protein assembly factor BamA [Candidatus Hydrogenedentes bacterium]|nr:outer membrane protein assembly factor BamA [Candidatus Hydrogenedentota bacterium]
MKKLALGLALALFTVLTQSQAGAQAGGTVGEVRIDGLERVSEQLVRSKLEVQAGQEYNPLAVSRDIRRLNELGFFTQIKADAARENNALTITYIVAEKQVIEKVLVMGNKKIKERRILSALSMREGDPFIPEAYEEERIAILGLYEGKGFANTTVDVVAERVGPSRMRLIYTIQEGRKARIRSIKFEGNDTLSGRKLRKLMATKQARWFLGGKYEEEKLEFDLQQIINNYGDFGRLEAEITKTDLLYSDNGKKMDLTIHVQEGAEYKLDNLEIAGNAVFDDDELLEQVEVTAGEVHNKSQVEKDAAELQDGYQSSGYVAANVSPVVILDKDNKTTRVTHKIEEGDLKYIREVKIIGNELTKDEVIRRQLALEPGERYDGSRLELSKRNLQRTEYFETVRTNLNFADDEDLFTDLIFDVEEGKQGNFNFGAGFSSDEGLGGFAELRLNNFDALNWPNFTGGGQQLALKFNIGSQRDQYSLSFTDPEFLGYPFAVGFDVFDDSYEVRGGADYTEDRQGGQLRLGKTLSNYVSMRSALRHETTEITGLPFFVNPIIRRQAQESTTISLQNEFERNTLDAFRDPTKGSKHVLSLEFAGLGGDNDFYKVFMDSQWYRALDEKEKWIFSFRSREGYVAEYGNSDYVPLTDKFYAGGTNTVRGYDNRDIGPKAKEYIFFGDEFPLGGNITYIGNLELKYKLTEQMRFYTFIDAGGVWDDSDFDFGEMRYSAGIGIGMEVPRLGPIRVDYGIPLNADEDQGSGRLHLISGIRF